MEEAKEKRAKMLEEAESIAREQADKLARQVAEEEAKLKSARASVAAMTASIRDLLAHEQEFLDSLPDPEAMAAETPAAEEGSAVADEVVSEIGDSIRRVMQDEPAPAQAAGETPAAAEAEEEPQEEAAEEEAVKTDEAPAAAPARPTSRIVDDDVDDAPTRRLDLSELRFGRNYEIK